MAAAAAKLRHAETASDEAARERRGTRVNDEARA
jgi:hypothetical protein